MAEAVWRQHRIAVRYRSWSGDVERVLEPYGLVLKGGRWYTVAGRPGRDGPATYRINQILSLNPLDEEFPRPAGFDLPAWWRAHVRRFRAGLYRDVATVRLSHRGRQRLREIASELVVAAVDDTAGPPDDAGWTTAVIPIESLTHAHGELLRLGADVEVLTPPGLRDRLAATAADLAALYARHLAERGGAETA